MIGPAESSGMAPEAKQARVRPADGPKRTPVFLGVLRLGDPLLEIWPGRVVPLMHGDPKMIKVSTPKGPRFILCMLVPFRKLTVEDQAAVIAKVAVELSMPVEAALAKLQQLGFYAIQKIHFAAVLQASEKEGATAP